MDNAQTLVERLLATKRVVSAFCSMDRTTEYEDRLVNPDGPEAAATITALEAEINLKADFIEATINQLAQADDDKAALQARVGEVAEYLIDQRDEPFDETDRLHYWRDKAITAARRIRAAGQP